MSTAVHAIDAPPRVGLGLFLGPLRVIALRLTRPMTRYAAAELDPWATTRAAVGAARRHRGDLWALAVALPVTAAITLGPVWNAPPHSGAAAWAAFGYVTPISQLIGFFAWYNGIAPGGIARVGQVQLLQAFFTIGCAALRFGERVEPVTRLFAAAAVATIAIGRTAQRRNA